MRVLFPLLAVSLWGLPPSYGQTDAVLQNETLRFAVNWPSGLSLGEGQMNATFNRQTGNWEFQLTLDAAIPGFQVLDNYRSVATAELCSLEFHKDLSHGTRRAREKTVFDPQAGKAVRTTLGGGGTSELPTAACAKDALTFLYFLRRELGLGRVPPAQTVYFGAPYQTRVDYKGTQTLRLGEGVKQADRLVVSLKGPASQLTFEVFIAREPTRPVVLIKAPLSLGVFSLELQP